MVALALIPHVRIRDCRTFLAASQLARSQILDWTVRTRDMLISFLVHCELNLKCFALELVGLL